MIARKLGVDVRSGRLLVASVDTAGGRPSIIELTESSQIDLNAEALNGHSCCLAIPDSLTMFKRFSLSASNREPLAERLVFEMVQSLLEDESLFRFEFESIPDTSEHLGLASRRDALARLLTTYNLTAEGGSSRSDYHSRALSLGRAYLTFCRQDASDLVTLADVTTEGVSICVIHQRKIVDLSFLPLTTPGPLNEQLPADLKMFVGFRLASLRDLRLNVTLATLLVSGLDIDDDFCDSAGKYFPSGVTSPRIQSGFLSASVACPEDKLPLYIVALGLTAN